MTCEEPSEAELWDRSATTDGVERTDVLFELGSCLYRRSAFDEAAAVAGAAADLYREAGYPRRADHAVFGQGAAWEASGRPDDAAGAFAEAQALFGEVGDEVGTAKSLLRQGEVLVAAGDLDGAAPLLPDAHRLFGSANELG